MSKQAPIQYRFAAVAVDVVVLSFLEGELQALLMEVDRPPHYTNVKAFVGGIMEVKETADDAVMRHLHQKAGIQKLYTEQLYTFTGVERDKRNRVVAVAYMGLMDPDAAMRLDLTKVAWVPVGKVGTLAYDHNEMLAVAKKRLRGKLAYTNIARYLLTKKFTLTELQTLYETVESKPFDKRNFRKKILSLDIIEETGEKQEGVKNRPAALYTFKGSGLTEMALIGA